jgi:hypothetical protein
MPGTDRTEREDVPSPKKSDKFATPRGATSSQVANPKDLVGAKRVSLTKIPPVALAHAGFALMNGAGKYGPYNWRGKPVRATIYVDACERHLNAWLDGEEDAADSGAHHLGHAIACLAILLDAQETGSLVDDRPVGDGTGGAFCRVLTRLNRKIAAGARSVTPRHARPSRPHSSRA